MNITTTIIIEVVVIAILLFVLVNYFINSSYEVNIINEIIKFKTKEGEKEMTEDEIYYALEGLKSKYLKHRFKVYLTRSIIFGAGLWFIITYFMPSAPQKKVYDPFTFMNGPNSFMQNQMSQQLQPQQEYNRPEKGQKISLDEKLQPRRMPEFFDHPPW